MQRSISRSVWTIALLGMNGAAMAGEPAHTSRGPQEPVGFVTGAVVGAFAGEAAQAEARVAMLERASEKPVTDPPPPASPTTAEVLDGLQGDVLFRTGSAEITPEIAHQVQVLAQAVTKSSALKVRIDGYADRRGSDALNLKLSQDRAAAVRDLLLAAGVAPQVVELNAYGKTQSVAQDDDGYALERRVRVTLRADNGAALVSASGISLR